MTDERSLCVACAWRKECQKRFLKGVDVTLNCPDYTRDMSIKDSPEKPDVEKKDSGGN